MDARDKREAITLMVILPIIAVGMFIIAFARGHIILKFPIEDSVIVGVAGSLLYTVVVIISWCAMRQERRRRGE